jgi:hypothetical protein
MKKFSLMTQLKSLTLRCNSYNIIGLLEKLQNIHNTHPLINTICIEDFNVVIYNNSDSVGVQRAKQGRALLVNIIKLQKGLTHIITRNGWEHVTIDQESAVEIANALSANMTSIDIQYPKGREVGSASSLAQVNSGIIDLIERSTKLSDLSIAWYTQNNTEGNAFEFIPTLGNVIAENTSIKNLSVFSGTSINTLHIATILSDLSKSTSIQSINFKCDDNNHFSITHEYANCIVAIINGIGTLTSLTFDGTRIKENDAINIIDAVSSHQNIHELSFVSCRLTGACMPAIARLIKNDTHDNILLCKNKAFQKCPSGANTQEESHMSLSIYNNRFKNDAMLILLIDSIKQKTNIRAIDLSNCEISNDSYISLVNTIETNRNINLFDFQGNSRIDSLQPLIRAVIANRCIEVVCVTGILGVTQNADDHVIEIFQSLITGLNIECAITDEKEKKLTNEIARLRRNVR